MHYVRSEHRLSDSPIPIQADYGLDGQFVSNWEDMLLLSERNLSLKQQIVSHFVTFFIIQFVAAYFAQILLLIVLFKLIQHYGPKFTQNPTTSSAISLSISFYICLIMFGIAMLGAELSYMSNFSYNHILVRVRLTSILFSLGCYTLFGIIISCCTWCNKSEQQNLSLCLLLAILRYGDFLFAFAISWILSSLYATLLYSLAYPIYVIILFTLHVTIFIMTIIIFAVFVPNVISGWNKYTRVLQRFIFICFITILVVGVCAIYVAVISAFGSTIVERIFPQDGLVQALLLLPPLFVFLGVWLLQRNVFSKCRN